MPRRLRACLLSLLLLQQPGPAVPLGAMLAAGAVTEAVAQARSSGGYARPPSGYGRTPSFGGPRVAPRTPSTSGGYGRPSPPVAAYPHRPSVDTPIPGGSAWDRRYSQERSAEALNRMRRQQEPVRPPSPAPNQDPDWWRRGGTAPIGRNGGWYGDRGWSPSGASRGASGGLPGLGQRSFGLWNGVFLGYLLSNLGRAGAVDFFHNHQDDAGYREWRAEAERQARDNAELRQRLDELDRRLAEREGQPRDPNYLPPDVPPEVALAPRADARTPGVPRDEAGLSPLLWLLILGGGAFVFLAWRRRRLASPVPTGGVAGVPGRRVPDLGARPDFSAAPRFRLGMTVTCDPTPFLLGGAALKVPPPSVAGADGRVSVQAIGRIREGADELTRLYLPDGHGLFQIHLDAEGQFDECRYFATIDEVTPADATEWGVWLEPRQGMIGWPEFQTRDGKLYTRLWAPGPDPVPPRQMVETIEGLGGTQELRIQAMLYAAPTGAAAPAPATEYILVSALEAGARAWVEIRAGVDINPASLSLA